MARGTVARRDFRGVRTAWWDGMWSAKIPCMERQWWNLGRPALMGFFVGLIVTAGIAWAVPHVYSSGKTAPGGP